MDKVVHFEIPADNVERAQHFYEDVFGWRIEQVPYEGGVYYMVNTVESDDQGMPKTPGAINGGLMPRQGQGETPVIVINVASVDDYTAKVETAGGTVVMPKTQVGEMGLYARVSDPEGNILGIWEDLPPSQS